MVAKKSTEMRMGKRLTALYHSIAPPLLHPDQRQTRPLSPTMLFLLQLLLLSLPLLPIQLLLQSLQSLLLVMLLLLAGQIKAGAGF